jgi:hypothetical protein
VPTVLVDTGIWYSLFDPQDEPRDRDSLERLSTRLAALTVAIPWPTMYETLRTKFVKKRIPLGLFERQLKAPNIAFVDDATYRVAALELAFDSSMNRGRPLSMTDCLIRLILDDQNVRINYLATYNVRDFVDVCASREIEIIGA